MCVCVWKGGGVWRGVCVWKGKGVCACVCISACVFVCVDVATFTINLRLILQIILNTPSVIIDLNIIIIFHVNVLR